MEPVSIVVERVTEIARSAIALSPQILIALTLILLTWLVSRIVRSLYRRAMRHSNFRRSLIVVLQKLITIVIWIVGSLIAATILFPDLTPSNILAGLGIGSIAIGLAFKDIFENFLAGVMILIREPMRIGDHVSCMGVEGKVEEITLRDTYIRQVDDQLVLLPNGTLFKNPVYILTDEPKRRMSIMCGVAYDVDLNDARKVIHSAVEGVDSVDTSKPVQVFAQSFGASSIDFEVTWWTDSKPVDERASRDTVITEIKAALDNAGMEIPFPYSTLTFKEPLAFKKHKQQETDSNVDKG